MEQVLAAIHTLFHGADQNACAQANEWLTRFQQTSDAWSTALQLLQHPSSEVQFFGAGILYTKAKSDWTISSSVADGTAAGGGERVAPGGISAAEQGQLMNQVLTALKALCEPSKPTAPFVLSKLAQSLGVMSVKTPRGPSSLLASVLPLSGSPFPSAAWVVLLELLSGLGEEVARASMGYAKGEEVKAQLRSQVEQVAAAIAKALREANQIMQQQQPQQLQALSPLLAKALQVLLSWREYGLSLVLQHSSGILSSLLELCARWCSVPLASSDAPGQLALLSAAVETLEALVREGTYPRPKGRDQCVDLIVQLIVQACKPVYERTVAECVMIRARSAQGQNQAGAGEILDRADQLCLLICRLSCALGESEGDMDYLACVPGSDEFPALSPGGTNAASPTPHAQANPLHLQFFELHLQFTSHPYHRVLVELSLETWVVLQDLPVAQRKFAWLKGEVFVALLAALLRQVAYPRAFRAWNEPMGLAALASGAGGAAAASPSELASAAYWSETFSEDRDAWLRFRAMLLDSFLSIHAILGSRYVELLAQAFASGEEQQGSSPPASSTPSWQRMEAILCALNFISADVRDSFSNEEDGSIDDKRMLHQHLSAIQARLWVLAPPTPAANMGAEAARAQAASAAASVAPPLLLASCCAFLKSFAFLACYAPPQQAQEMLERSVAFLLGVLPHTQAPQVPAASSRARRGASSSSGDSGADDGLFSSEYGALADRPNVAGLAFRSLCTEGGAAPAGASSPSTGTMLSHSPAVLAEVVRLLFRAPGWSEHVSTDMKRLWLEGLSALVASIAFSDDSVAQLRACIDAARGGAAAAPAMSSMRMASSYLTEITNPILGGLTAVMAHVAAGQQQAATAALAAGSAGAATWTPPAAELDAVRAELQKHVSLLLGVLERLAPPMPPSLLQAREDLLELVDGVVKTGQQPAWLAPSVAFQVFSAAWPALQQACAFLTPLRDGDTLNLIVRLYACTFPLLYPHELAPLLPALLQTALPLYRALPLSSVLDLLRTAVSTGHFGAHPEWRDQWNACLATLYRSTMAHVKDAADGMRGHAELMESFWPCLTAFYSHATYAFVSNPANTLPHLLQLTVSVLDSLSTHRGALLATLKFLESFLGDTAPVDLLDPLSKRELHTIINGVVAEQGSGLVRQLVANVTDGATLPPLLDRHIFSLLFKAQQRWPDARDAGVPKWISTALMSPFVSSALPHLSEDDKMAFLALLLQPAIRSKIHQWNNLWTEFCKVCRREESMEALKSFQVMPQGTLRSSPQIEAAFATL